MGRIHVGLRRIHGCLRMGRIHVGLRRIALGRHPSWMAISYRWHGRNVGVGTISLRHLSLSLMLKLLEFLVRVKLFVIHCVPSRIFLKLVTLSLCQELIKAYHVTFVTVAFLENVFPHPLHFLLSL